MEHKTKKFRRVCTLAPLLCFALLTGCGEDEEPDQPGVLSVSWRVSPLGCAESGVRNIEVALRGASALTTERLLVGCDAAGTAIDNLAPGKYLINLLGLNEDGKPIFETGEMAFGINAGEITDLGEQRLTAKQAALTVFWYFDNGRLCTANGIGDMAVAVYDTDGYLIEETSVSCESGGGIVENLKSGKLVIEVVGKGADGRGLYRGLQQVEVTRGDELNVEIAMIECAEGC